MSGSLDRVQLLLDQLAQLGPMLPGTISTQWNVCGKAGCRCKDPHKPRKHGPYYQLSYTLGGKSSTAFVPAAKQRQVRSYIAATKRFRALQVRLLQENVALLRQGEI